MANGRRRTMVPAMAAAAALLLSGCSSADDAGTADPRDDVTSAPEADQTTNAPEPTESEAAPLDAVPDELVGTWRISSSRVVEYTADRETIMREDGEVMVQGSFTIYPNTIVLNNESGPLACQTGPATYEWEVSDDVLTLTAVSDDCDGRRENTDGLPRERVE